MTTNKTVLILMGQERPNLDVEPESPSTSSITGRELRRLSIRATVGEQLHEALAAQVQSARSPNEPIIDVTGGRWRVVESSYSYSDGAQPVQYRHTFELEEVERVAADAVLFEGLTLPGDTISIPPRDEQLVVELLVNVTADVSAQIEGVLLRRRGSDDPFFPVEIRGLLDEPVLMRFGRCLWEPAADGSVQHLLVFVSESGDADREPWVGINEPETARLLDAAIATEARLSALIEELTAAGALSEGAVQRIESATASPPPHARRNFERAVNIERFYN